MLQTHTEEKRFKVRPTKRGMCQPGLGGILIGVESVKLGFTLSGSDPLCSLTYFPHLNGMICWMP